MMDGIEMETSENILQFKLKKTRKLRKSNVVSQSMDNSSRRKMRISKEEKRTMFYISKSLEAMSPTERANLLNALNIDQQSLVPKSEQEFKRECETLEAAQILHRYHQQRMILNFQKIKDFLKKTQRRGAAGCIYLSKEGSRLLDKRASNSQKGYNLKPQTSMTSFADRTLDGSMHSPYQVMNSNNYAHRVPSTEFTRPQTATNSPEDLLNQRLVSHSKRLKTQARVQQNKEKLQQEQQQRLEQFEKAKAKRQEKKREQELDLVVDQYDRDVEKQKKRDRILKNQSTIELQEQQRVSKLTDRLQSKDSNSRMGLLKQSTSQGHFEGMPHTLMGAMSATNLRNAKMTNLGSGSDDLTALHYQNYNFSGTQLKQDAQEAQSIYHGHQGKNMTVVNESPDKSASQSNYGSFSQAQFYRPMTAQNKVLTGAFQKRKPSARSTKKGEMSIEMMCKSIEDRMASAQRRREKNLNQVKMRIKFDNARREHQTQNLIKDVQDNIYLEENPVLKKKLEDARAKELENPDNSPARKAQLKSSSLLGRPQSALQAPSGFGKAASMSRQQASVFGLRSSMNNANKGTISGASLNPDTIYSDMQKGTALGKRSESHLLMTKATSQAALDFTQNREMLKKHQTLHRYYQKQSKSNQALALNKEWQEYNLMDKKEAQEARKQKMDLKRTTIQEQERARITQKIQEKEARSTFEGSDTRSQLTSMRSSARLWRGIAQMDQYENMKRNQELQRAYKQKLIDDLLQKEQKYFRTKKLKEQAKVIPSATTTISSAYQ